MYISHLLLPYLAYLIYILPSTISTPIDETNSPSSSPIPPQLAPSNQNPHPSEISFTDHIALGISHIRDTYLGADLLDLTIRKNSILGVFYDLNLLWQSPQNDYFRIRIRGFNQSPEWVTLKTFRVPAVTANGLKELIFDWGVVSVQLDAARVLAGGPGRTRGPFYEEMIFKEGDRLGGRALSGVFYRFRSNKGYDVFVGAEEGEVLPIPHSSQHRVG